MTPIQVLDDETFLRRAVGLASLSRPNTWVLALGMVAVACSGGSSVSADGSTGGTTGVVSGGSGGSSGYGCFVDFACSASSACQDGKLVTLTSVPVSGCQGQTCRAESSQCPDGTVCALTSNKSAQCVPREKSCGGYEMKSCTPGTSCVWFEMGQMYDPIPTFSDCEYAAAGGYGICSAPGAVPSYGALHCGPADVDAGVTD